jgi:hypothetical protein
VDERRPECQKRVALEIGVVRVVGFLDCRAQRDDGAVDRSRVHRCLTRLEARRDAGSRADPLDPLAAARGLRSEQDGRARVDPELHAEEGDARVALSIRGRPVAGGGVRPNQQLLGILVEPVGSDEAAGQLDSPLRIPDRQLGPSGFAQHVVGRTRQPPAFGQEPHFERRA